MLYLGYINYIKILNRNGSELVELAEKKQIVSSLIIILVLGGLIAVSLVKTHYKANETKIGQVVRRNLELFKKEVKKEDGKKLKRILKKHIFFN